MRIRRRAASAALGLGVLATSIGTGAAVGQDGDAVYYLPAPAGTELIVAQGNDHPTGRRVNERYAFDLVAGDGVDEDFPVLASRGGVVIGQRSGIRNGRCTDPADGPRPSCWRRVNYVLIDHGDGTSGLYLHLRPGKTVSRGDIVSVGTRIGRAGRTGWTDETGVQIQLQRTPDPGERGRGGWFLTESEPLAFADPDVIDVALDGVPETGDTVVSANPGSRRDPFRFERRPVDLPAVVPFEAGEARSIEQAYEPDSPDGFGLLIATDPDDDEVYEDYLAGPMGADPPLEVGMLTTGTAVRPVFSGQLAYAGCAGGDASSLGLVVVIARELDEGTFYAIHGHLSDVDAAFLGTDLAFPPSIGANDTIGFYGGVPSAAATLCPDADPSTRDLFVGILQDAEIGEDGAITGGTPISPEPLLGHAAYEAFEWFRGPIESRVVDEQHGRPRGNWNRRSSAHASHVPYGEPVNLVVRVRDAADLHEVRFRAFYPGWVRPNAAARFPGFDPREHWRMLAVCRPPGAAGEPRRARGCDWDGDAGDAVVSYAWDPLEPETTPGAPWLPRARVAMAEGRSQCVPVSLGIEVVDASGHVRSELAELPRPARCDDRRANRSDGRVVYLDPLVPPSPPTARGEVSDRGWPPIYAPDPLDGAIIWRDRSDNEDGFRIYARRSYFLADCSLEHTSWRAVTDLPPDTQRYRPRHQRIADSIAVPEIPDVPGNIFRWEYAVSAFNEAGESRLLRVGGFVGGSEAFCDPGIDEPDIGP